MSSLFELVILALRNIVRHWTKRQLVFDTTDIAIVQVWTDIFVPFRFYGLEHRVSDKTIILYRFRSKECIWSPFCEPGLNIPVLNMR